MKIPRRVFLGMTAGIGAAAFLPAARGQGRQALRIPELLDARKLGQSLALAATPGRTQFFPGVDSATLGYNGSYLGPTLRVHRGDEVEIAVANRLEVETTVHWHGLLIPSDVDGGPHNVIRPGDAWRPVLPIRQPGATLFYHSHVHHDTARQVHRGLAGMMIVHDEREDAFGLPSRYGVDDIPVILQDRRFSAGRMAGPESGMGMMAMMAGSRGNSILVNGTPDAWVRVPRGRVRLRLLNASNAREYHLAFEDGRAFDWIATDGGLLEAPVRRRRIDLMPGERAEILVDFSSGAPALLFTRPDGNVPMMGMMGGTGGRALPVLAFEVGSEAGDTAALPARLVRHERADPNAVARVRRFTLDMGMMGGMGMNRGRGMGGMGGMGSGADMFSINGRPFDMGRVDERVRLGDTEVWEVSGDMMAHPFHVHGVHFEVIGRGGGAPGPADVGLKDTVRVDEPVRLLVRFTQAARERPFMYHCHILEHEDMGMMGQFTVA